MTRFLWLLPIGIVMLFWAPAMVFAQTPNVTIDDVYNAGRVEYVQITNRTAGSVPLSGWTIYIERGSQSYSFPSGYTLATGSTVKVHSGLGAVDKPPTDLVWTTSNVWNNQGDLVVLANGAGAEVWTYLYGNWSGSRSARTRR